MPGQRMSGDSRAGRNETSAEDAAAFERAFAQAAASWMAHANVVGVRIGRKYVGGVDTGTDAIIFRVKRKLADRNDILLIGSKPIPAQVTLAGRTLPTDVHEGQFCVAAGYGLQTGVAAKVLAGGSSVGNARSLASGGTAAAIVMHSATGRPVLLSSQHVLCRYDGSPEVCHPAPLDGGHAPQDVFGKVLASMRNAEGDAAIASIANRKIDPRIAGLNVAVSSIAMPAPDNMAVMSGRSGICYAKVSAAMAAVRIDYADGVPQTIQGFELMPVATDGGVPARMPEPGDSGSAWMLLGADGRPSSTMLGIHTGLTPNRKHAFASFARNVFGRLGVQPVPTGPTFAGFEVATPAPAPLMASLPTVDAQPLMRTIARNGLNLRAGPGRDFPTLQTLQLETYLRVLQRNGDWAMVDLANDGAADGYVYAAYLVPA